MTTARDFITLCLKEAGVTGVGQTPLPEDINDGFTLLTRMLARWQKKRWLVPNLYEIYAAGNNQKFNLIGPGQYYNAMRPDKIQAAYFKQLNSGNTENNVSYPLIPIYSWEDYSLIALKELNSWPKYFFYDGQFPYGRVYIWPIPTSSYEVHLVLKGPIGFTVVILEGEITNAGSGYTNGAYLAVPLTNISSFGSGATADITVAGGVVTAFALQDGGTGYRIGDVLSADTAIIGNGVDFTYLVNNVTTNLDAEFNMPDEYEEAIHYNLCVRLVAHYQLPANGIQGKLAKIALNDIKNQNAQIPMLKMPPALRFNRSGGAGFYIFNADMQ
jgi:hypothetical protein